MSDVVPTEAPSAAGRGEARDEPVGADDRGAHDRRYDRRTIMRAVNYASSEDKHDSIPDQARRCRQFAMFEAFVIDVDAETCTPVFKPNEEEFSLAAAMQVWRALDKQKALAS
jgi:hypothetical protein